MLRTTVAPTTSRRASGRHRIPKVLTVLALMASSMSGVAVAAQGNATAREPVTAQAAAPPT
ncbi:hypothetical protein, partial [Streptomyces sp. NPDC000188]|uniref:hypothetical protein n=1 Tax=Streptomyces sp. NPDC000188 TaxID=3154245 RepID=UPI00331F2882